MCSLVTPVFLYACGSWTLIAELQRRMQAIEMRCYHKILCISNKDHFTNEEACAIPVGNQTTQRPPDHHTDTQTEVVWTCLPFIRSSQYHLERHSERGKKTRQSKKQKEVGGQHQGMDRPGVRQVPKGSGEQRKMERLVVKSAVVPQETPPLN